MATTPNFSSTPKCASVNITTANANRDGTGTIGTVFTAGSSGSRIDIINIVATATTTAGMVRLFIHDGTSARLYDEVPVYAVTPANSIPAFSVTLGGNAPLSTGRYPVTIPTGYSLRASTHNAESFNIHAIGGDF
jgi:hypothetical protein